MGKLSQYFWSLAEESPSLIVMLACALFVFTRWKYYPKVALVVGSGLVLLIVHMIVFIFVYDLVPPLFLKDSLSQSVEETQRLSRFVFLALGLIYNSLKVVGFGLLLIGIFMQRPVQAKS